MFKLLGAAFIVGGCIAYGLLEKARMLLHIKQLKEAEKLMEYLESEITYGKASLGAACGESANRVEEPYAGFLKRVYEISMENEGQPFGDIWKKELLAISSKLLLKDEEREILSCFGNCSGYMDTKLQQTSVERLLTEMKKRTGVTEAAYADKSRVVFCLSAAGGMVLTMILI
ncbi:MAG: hypothetical protein GX234_10760 [Clostridiales bacterium]|nr:hypothetical protein [Clostridiales bacterium]